MSVDALEKRYAKAICHLNSSRKTNRLGLILGSGVSASLGIPKWAELIDSIEKRLGYSSGNAPESYRAEQLFQHYKKGRVSELGWSNGRTLEAAVTSGWRETVANCLYESFRDSSGNINLGIYRERIEQHPYLRQLGRLALSSELVVTHNFDDALELAIDIEPSSARRCHSFWRPEPFLLRGTVNVYHPNGFTPLRGGVKGSESLILTEASFADHLANTNTEESNFLLRHLADKTCLIIGHSLADGTLKNALRQHANHRPGHVNYYVHWHEEGEGGLTNDQRSAIREANFDTYNLVTIFANSFEIAELLRLVAMEEDDLEGHLARHSVPSRYVYYIVGAVSSGKSTTLRNLRDLVTVEEWPRDMPPIMNRPSLGLGKPQEEEIDKGLEDAIWKKNQQVRNIKVGIVAVDRAPLDFIAFPASEAETLGSTARNRADAVLERLSKSNLRDLCTGQIVVVRAEVDMLVERQLQRSGRTKPEDVASGFAARYLERQQLRLAQVYDGPIKAGSQIENDRCSIATSVRAAARIIHFGDYTPFDFGARLREIQGGA